MPSTMAAYCNLPVRSALRRIAAERPDGVSERLKVCSAVFESNGRRGGFEVAVVKIVHPSRPGCFSELNPEYDFLGSNQVTAE